MESKPGYKTTEFWLTLASQLISVAMMVLGAVRPDSQFLAYLGVALSALSGLGYGASRTLVKSGASKLAEADSKMTTEILKATQDPFLGL